MPCTANHISVTRKKEIHAACWFDKTSYQLDAASTLNHMGIPQKMKTNDALTNAAICGRAFENILIVEILFPR